MRDFCRSPDRSHSVLLPRRGRLIRLSIRWERRTDVAFNVTRRLLKDGDVQSGGQRCGTLKKLDSTRCSWSDAFLKTRRG
ncbi:protein of unknown function [Azospirillum baldaniorum]|uniref:Uncharacterized protein n=1 Tax=Azospirillum baldaniorum TaxID=1064539 RepID=A0A9P1JN26_9PROT|nr:protein of unknown function [Azospirillum baldaniorum]